MDLTKYGASPYGPGSPLRGDQNQSPLAAALRGVLGQEEPGSVLDPATAGLKSINDKANLASILSDLVPAKGAAALPHAAGIFIGPKAKTWNAAMAAKAAELLKQGHSAESVRRVTGTHFGADGLPRQEISDAASVLRRFSSPNASTVAETLDHPELVAAYPELAKKIKVKINKAPDETGMYHNGGIQIDAPDESSAKSLLLHEIQHGIQEAEGFARGGSPEEFIKNARWAAKKRGMPDGWAEEKAYNDYLKLAGENESNLVQKRRGLTQEELSTTPLRWHTPLEDQKLKFYENQGEIANAVRRGGRPDLFLAHGANVSGLMKDGELISELTHPSMALTKDSPATPWGDVMFIPREGKFDPRTSPAALHDMDAWTPSWNDNAYTSATARNEVGSIENDAQARLFDKFGHRWDKGGLNQAGPAAIGANRFPSFEAFENAARGGVKRLEGGTPVPHAHFEFLKDPRLSTPKMLEKYLRGEIGGPADKVYAQEIMKSMRQSPQDYAELKVFGHVPLTADNFAGVLAKQGTPEHVIQALRDRGLHVKTYDPWNSHDMSKGVLGQYADELQALSRQSMTPVPGASGPNTLPQAMPYDKVVETLRQKKLKEEYVANGLTPDGEKKWPWQQYPEEWATWNDAAKENWLKFNKIDPNGEAPNAQWGEVLGKKKLAAKADELWPDTPHVDKEWEKFDPETGFGIDAVKPLGTPAPPAIKTPEGKTAVDLLGEGLTWDQIAELPGFEFFKASKSNIVPGSEAPKTMSLTDMLKAHVAAPPKTLHEEFDFKVNPKDKSVYVYKKDEPDKTYQNAIAWLGVEPVPGGKHWAEDVVVSKPYQKQGIATEMYQQLIDAGMPMAKSNDVTKEGEAMWAAWHKKGLAKNNEFIGKPK